MVFGSLEDGAHALDISCENVLICVQITVSPNWRCACCVSNGCPIRHTWIRNTMSISNACSDEHSPRSLLTYIRLSDYQSQILESSEKMTLSHSCMSFELCRSACKSHSLSIYVVLSSATALMVIVLTVYSATNVSKQHKPILHALQTCLFQSKGP